MRRGDGRKKKERDLLVLSFTNAFPPNFEIARSISFAT